MATRIPGRVHGEGVRARHSRPCLRGGEGCICNPSYEAFVWIRHRQAKERKTWPTISEARAWRLSRLRSIYGLSHQKDGELKKAYGLLRKSAQEMDRALVLLNRRSRPNVRDALDSLYRAEEKLLDAMLEQDLDG